MHRKNDKRIDEDTHHDGRHAVEQIRRVSDKRGSLRASKLCEIDASKETDRNTDRRGQKQKLAGTDKSVGHASTVLSNRNRKLSKEVPVKRESTINEEVAKHKDEYRHHQECADTGERQHNHVDYSFTRRRIGGRSHSRTSLIPVVNMRSRAAAFTIILRTKSTRAISMSACR